MKTIAFWSRDHKNAARLLIAICHILIFCLAWYAGNGLKQNDLFISPVVLLVSVSLFALTFILFSRSYASYSFYRKKILDSVVLLCAFVMIITAANQQNSPSVFYNTLRGSFDQKKVNASAPVSKPSVKELKKQFKMLKKMAREDKASAEGVVLAIVAGLGLGLLVAAASCSLACDGQDGLALVVLLGGLTAIFFICKLILKSTKKKSKEPPPTVTSAS